MFKIPRVNVVESDEGFSVEVLGQVGLLYSEGSKNLHIDSEMLAMTSRYVLALFTSSIRTWDPPDNSETIDENKRSIIVENIRSAFRFQGFEIEVH